jgi:hypothetical protein
MAWLRSLQRHTLPAPTVDEAWLFHQVSHSYPELRYAHLDHVTLARVSAEQGTDFATALFYHRLRHSLEHGRFIQRVEALHPCLDRLPRLGGTLLVAPAALYQEYPEFGGDGALVCEIAARFGMRAEVAPVASAGRLEANAALLRQEIRRHRAAADGPLVVASLSKGGADVRLALAEDPEAAAAIFAWVQLCGLVRGTPAVDDLLQSRLGVRGLTRAFLRAHGVDTDFLRDLATTPHAPLRGLWSAPPGLCVINVIGCPLAYHLSGATRARYRVLAPLGPNDGSTLLRDAILEPGWVYPVWGADHYFRTPSASDLLYRLFLLLHQEWETSSIPDSRLR